MFDLFRPTSHMAIKCICVYLCVLVSVCGNFYCLLFASCRPQMKCLNALLSCMYFDTATVLNGFPMCPMAYILPCWQLHAHIYKIFFLFFFHFLSYSLVVFLEQANQMCSNRDALEIIKQWNLRGGSFCSMRRKFITNLHSNNPNAHRSGK